MSSIIASSRLNLGTTKNHPQKKKTKVFFSRELKSILTQKPKKFLFLVVHVKKYFKGKI